MNYNQLKYVVSLAECGSFSRAAKELFITQPSLSNQIKALEEEIGTPLFIRNHHNIQLTEAGHDFLLHSRRILNEMENLQNMMMSYSSYSRGHLTIGIFSNGSYLGIMECIMTFQKLYPKIEISIIMDHSSNLIRLLMTQEIDIAILTSNEPVLKTNDFQYVQLTEESLVAVVPCQHPFSNRSSLQLKELKNEKIILPPEGSHLYSLITSIFAGGESKPNICGQCSSTENCIQMVTCGFGISVTTASTAKKLKNNTFNLIPILPPVRTRIYLAMLKTSYPGSITDELFNFLQTQFR